GNCLRCRPMTRLSILTSHPKRTGLVAAVLIAAGAVLSTTLPKSNPPRVNHAAGVTYYVSATGTDANNGLTATTAWRSISKANATVKPGDTVILIGAFVKEVIAPARSG